MLPCAKYVHNVLSNKVHAFYLSDQESDNIYREVLFLRCKNDLKNLNSILFLTHTEIEYNGEALW